MQPKPAELCGYCSAMVQMDPSIPPGKPLPTLAALRDSSTNCIMCKIFLASHCRSGQIMRKRFPDVNEATLESLQVDITLRNRQRDDSGLISTKIETRLFLDSHGMVYPQYFFLTACDSQSSCANLPGWKSFPTSLNDKISTTRNWLNNCKLNHPDCRPSVGHLPKRLIEIGKPNGSGTKLIYTQGLIHQNIRYATLSYCWGNSAQIKTTKKTEKSFCDEIPYNMLPRTFREALAIAYSLDIPYIWIDSLCILQDDIKDWQSEALRMRDFYSGSTLTIAASDAKDPLGGCFAEELETSLDIGDTHKQVFLTTSKSGGETNLLVQVEPRDSYEHGRSSAIQKRGWVLQEMVLSSRIIQSFSSELHWQCKVGGQTETGVPHTSYESSYGNLFLLNLQVQSSPHNIWWRWMESYSSRHFTFPGDRIPAMAGIIDHYERAMGDTSFLGLWKNSLHQDLLWMRIGTPRKDELDTPELLLNIPSWSLLSCPAEITYDFWKGAMSDETHDHVDVLDCKLSWTSKPFVSAVKSTLLVINGPIREIFLEMAPEAKSFNPPYFNVEHEVPNFNAKPIPWRCAAQFDNQIQRPPGRWLCILLRSRHRLGTPAWKETFMILEPVQSIGTSRESSYRRVGIGMIKGQSRTFGPTIRQTFHMV